MSDSQSDVRGLLPCRGCDSIPIDVGNMGRHKFACPLYYSHDPETTDDCDCHLMRPMWHDERDALQDWNDAQEQADE
jgi:hypothetical protein